jgi:3-deoxy-7-phosphoheptulonate synthase
MIDTSHGNSGKDHRNQPIAAHAVAEQVAAGERGISGVLMESFLADGRQDFVAGKKDRAALVYGQSITDACMGWEMTLPVLHELAEAVRARRRSA